MKHISRYLIILCVLLVATHNGCSEGSELYSSQPIDPIPDDFCGAIVTYLSEIDAVKGTDSKSQRLEGYAQARAKLEPWLKKYERLSVSKEILDYATYSEMINNGDATDPKFIGYVDKTLKIRASIIDRCNSFIVNR